MRKKRKIIIYILSMLLVVNLFFFFMADTLNYLFWNTDALFIGGFSNIRYYKPIFLCTIIVSGGICIILIIKDILENKLNSYKGEQSMFQKITSKVDNSTIKGDYVGGNKTVANNYYYNVSDKEQDTAAPGDKTIFLSYNWNDTDIADKIDTQLSSREHITVKRDIRDVGTWKSFKKFMQGIRQQDYAVLVVSDLYLKSRNCMFEVLEMMKEQQYQDRIFPAVVERGIYDPLKRVEYIKHWEQESEKLEAAIKGINFTNAPELAADLKSYKNIASSMGEFLKLVADMNNPDIDDVAVQVEKAIFK